MEVGMSSREAHDKKEPHSVWGKPRAVTVTEGGARRRVEEKRCSSSSSLYHWRLCGPGFNLQVRGFLPMKSLRGNFTCMPKMGKALYWRPECGQSPASSILPVFCHPYSYPCSSYWHSCHLDYSNSLLPSLVPFLIHPSPYSRELSRRQVW